MDREISEIEFSNIKKQTLLNVDNSKKRSIDGPIISLLGYLNKLNDFVTTSSCSGRIIITKQDSSDVQKKNCLWVLNSHELVNEDEISNALQNNQGGYLVLKFEPFILHVQARTLSAAKSLLNLGLSTGFRNSGIVLGKHGKITVAIRSTSNLEIPLTDGKKIIIGDDFLNYTTHLLNEKMIKNFGIIQKFEKAVLERFCN